MVKNQKYPYLPGLAALAERIKLSKTMQMAIGIDFILEIEEIKAWISLAVMQL